MYTFPTHNKTCPEYERETGQSTKKIFSFIGIRCFSFSPFVHVIVSHIQETDYEP